MDKFKKDKNLLNGKGEDDIKWITVKGNHIPIQKGQSVEDSVTHYFENIEKKESLENLIGALKKIKKIKLKEIHDYIKTLNPIYLKINNDEILAKQIGRASCRERSDAEGYRYKISNPTEIPNIIKGSKYNYSQKEIGKTSQQHKGVKVWHYFKNEIKTEKGVFNIVVNIRDKGNSKFVYEIAIKKKRT